jgi:2'-5' RNA ligase
LREQRAVDLEDVSITPVQFPVERITLFESRLGRPSARYSAVATFPFRRS